MFKKQDSICPRPELKWTVSAQIGGAIIHGETKDISPQGAFIRCRNPLNLNEVFDMVVAAPGKSLNVKAEVVWSNIYGPDDEINPRGMGLRFLEISHEDRQIIAKAVLQHLQSNKKNIGALELRDLQTLILDQDQIGPGSD